MACAGFLKLFGIHPGLSAQPTVASARTPTSVGFNPVFRRAGNRGMIVWLLLACAAAGERVVWKDRRYDLRSCPLSQSE